MFSFSDAKLDEYVLGHIVEEDKVLYDLNRDTHCNLLYSRMCSGHIQGSILTMFSQLIRP